jgi:hypothetical protein
MHRATDGAIERIDSAITAICDRQQVNFGIAGALYTNRNGVSNRGAIKESLI